MSRYILDNAGEETGERFAGLEACFDPVTIRQLEAIGVTDGWSCLEVGGGGGSIARWLAPRVGADGRVVVTDINPRWLKVTVEHVELRRHDREIDGGPLDQPLALERRVEVRELQERGARRARHKRQEGQLPVTGRLAIRVEPSPDTRHAVHVHLDLRGHVRGRPAGPDHVLGDGPSHGRRRDDPVGHVLVAAWELAGSGEGCLGRLRGRSGRLPDRRFLGLRPADRASTSSFRIRPWRPLPEIVARSI
jgi:hypothetical protein